MKSKVGMNREARRLAKKNRIKLLQRTVVVPVLTAVVLLSSIAGCNAMDNQDFVKMIDSGQEVSIEVLAPESYVIEKPEAGSYLQDLQWLQLDQNKMYNSNIREKVDKYLKIKKVSYDGVIGKSGSMYVGKGNVREGNASLADALRNKVFVTKYYNNKSIRTALSKLGKNTFKDLGKDSGLMATLNAYYSILPNYAKPDNYFGTSPLSREQFFAMVYKSENGVDSKLVQDKAFNSLIGGESLYSRFAKEEINNGYLKITDGSLDGQLVKSYITKGEAVYALVNKHFKDKLETYQPSDGALKGFVDAGDLADTLGMKGKEQEAKVVMAYMIKSEEGELSGDMYKTLAYAESLGLIKGETFNFGEVLSKEEGLQLVVDVQLAKNKVYGYATTVEYGKNTKSGFDVTLDSEGVIGVDEAGALYGKNWSQINKNAKELKLTDKVNGVTVKELQGIIKWAEKNGKEFVSTYMGTYYPNVDIGVIKAVKEPVVVKKAPAQAKKVVNKSGVTQKKEVVQKKESTNKSSQKNNSSSKSDLEKKLDAMASKAMEAGKKSSIHGKVDGVSHSEGGLSGIYAN